MADRLLLESGTYGYLLEDGSGVLDLENIASGTTAGTATASGATVGVSSQRAGTVAGASVASGSVAGLAAGGVVLVVVQPQNSERFLYDPSMARVVRAAGWGIPPYTLARGQQRQAEEQRQAREDRQQRLVEEDWLFGLIDDQEYARSAA
jgi:hypothetical protein